MKTPLVIVDTERRHADALQMNESYKRTQLTPKEMDLLILLGEAQGKVLSRAELLKKIWGYSSLDRIETRTIDQHLARLRFKLGKLACQAVVTVTGKGYQAVAVQLLSDNRTIAVVKKAVPVFEKGRAWLDITHRVPLAAMAAPKAGVKHQILEVA